MPVVFDDGARLGLHVPVLVIGAGACGLVAALAARDAGAEVLVLERDGVSGAHVWGYLSGNGLLTAVTLGRIAGANAAAIA